MEHYFQQIRDEFDAADKAHKDSFWQFRAIAEKHHKGEISSDEYFWAEKVHRLSVKRFDAVDSIMQEYQIKTNDEYFWAEVAEARDAMEHAAWYNASAELI
jgi:hypothetical protein